MSYVVIYQVYIIKDVCKDVGILRAVLCALDCYEDGI